MIYRETLEAHPWEPEVNPEYKYLEKERQWLLIKGNDGQKMAFLHCYLACQSFTSNDFIKWNEDLCQLISKEAVSLKSTGHIILAMGDFNTHVGLIPGLEGNNPGTNRNEPIFMSFLKEVNLLIINTLPICKEVFTWFRGDRKSLLDYGLIDGDNVGYVSSFTIDEKARHACGSDHALLECKLLFGTTPRINWNYQDVLHYKFNDNTDFTNYKSELEDTISEHSLEEFSDMSTSEMLDHLVKSINNTARKVFGISIKKKGKGRKLPRDLIAKIKEKERVSQSLHEAYSAQDPVEIDRLKDEFMEIKGKVNEQLCEGRLRKRNKLRANLLNNDPNRKKFWRFIKTQIKKAGNIPALENKVRDRHNNSNFVLKSIERG